MTRDRFDIVPLSKWGIFDNERPCIIAGPCSAESREQLFGTASELKSYGIGVIRAGLWKPRTHPGGFEGVGDAGLEWLSEIKRDLGVRVCTEVAGARHVRQCLEAGVDLLWIGARTTSNPFLVQEIADALKGCDIPVLVKNPISVDLGLWTGALERLVLCGVKKMGVIHRGFTSGSDGIYRNDPQWSLAVSLRSMHPELPFFCDPSHMGGKREYIGEISQRALDLGLDGLMIESHCNPSCALSDSSQQLSPEELHRMLSSLESRCSEGEDAYRTRIASLRSRIDEIDDELLACLCERMNVSREIASLKKHSGVSVIQAGRWEEVLERIGEQAASKNLDPHFVRELFSLIHDCSVTVQDRLISGKS